MFLVFLEDSESDCRCTGGGGETKQLQGQLATLPAMDNNSVTSTLPRKAHSANVEFFSFPALQYLAHFTVILNVRNQCQTLCLYRVQCAEYFLLLYLNFPFLCFLIFFFFNLVPGGNQPQGKETEMQDCIRKHHLDYILLMSC